MMSLESLDPAGLVAGAAPPSHQPLPSMVSGPPAMGKKEVPGQPEQLSLESQLQNQTRLGT